MENNFYIDALKQNRVVGIYGIKYLDDKLKHILLGDLIIIGARSGAGKSSLAEMIALNNVKAGYPVHLFSLENFTNDTKVKKMYRIFTKMTGRYDISIIDFISGCFDMDKYAKELDEARKRTDELFKDLLITYRQPNYTVDSLIKDMEKTVKENGTRLIILDHLDYIEKDNKREDDISHMTELMKTIRSLQDEFKVAVVAFSHLRKNPPMFKKSLIPTIDEFTGTANKIREATAVIMIAPDDEENDKRQSNEKITIFAIQKSRWIGYANNYGMLFYNTKTGEYEQKYEEFYLYKGDKVKV